jgi:hypothetical protein
MFWSGATFAVLIVLTFLLGIPTSFLWVVRKFRRFYLLLAGIVALTFLPGLADSPGVTDARTLALWTATVTFALPFVGAFGMISWHAWGNAVAAFQDQRDIVMLRKD